MSKTLIRISALMAPEHAGPALIAMGKDKIVEKIEEVSLEGFKLGPEKAPAGKKRIAAGKQVSSKEAVLGYFRDHPEPLTAATISNWMRDNGRSYSQGFSIIRRLTEDGVLLREGKLYRLAPTHDQQQQEEAPTNG